MTFNELIKKLEKAGCKLKSTGRGSCRKYETPDGKMLIVHYHAGKEVKKGLAEKILRDAGIQ